MPSHSKQYAERFYESKKTGTKFEQPERFPLDYGRLFYAFPYEFSGYDYSKTIRWQWIDIVFDRHFWVSFAAGVCTLLFLILIPVSLASSGHGRRAATAFAVIFFIAATVLIYVRVNMARNENYRRSVCFTYAKSLQAKKLWEEVGEGEQKVYAKDVYFSSSNYVGVFNVLRDGSVEVIPARLDESGSGVNNLAIEMDPTSGELKLNGGGAVPAVPIATDYTIGGEKKSEPDVADV